MNLEFKSITLRNFLSFGNVEETIPLNKELYQVIVGMNRDKSDSSSDRNGVGKSTIFEALHYAMFGKSIGNKITLGDLINNINKKNMVVTLVFEKNGIEYTIQRGRSPNFLKFLKNGDQVVSDESQGDSRETQKEIEKVLGMNEDIYNQIVCLSCKVPIFTDQTTANQKNIIEHILGINIISEKIECLKALIKETKNSLNNEQFKYNTIKTQNDSLLMSINKQISDMNVAKEKWELGISQQIKIAEEQIFQMKKIDIDEELKNFQLLENYLKQEGVNQQNQQLKDSLNKQISEKEIFIKNYQIRINDLLKYDFVTEKQNILHNEIENAEQIKYSIEENQYKTRKTFKEQNLDYNFHRIAKEIEKKETELANIKEDICPTCGHPMSVEAVNKLREEKKDELDKLRNEYHKIDMEILETNHFLNSFVPRTFEFKPVSFNNMNSLLEKENELNQLKIKLEETVKEYTELKEQEKKIVIVDLGIKPITHYSNIQEALQHQAKLESLNVTINSLKNQLLTNPFEQQEKSIEELKNNLQVLDDTNLKNIQDDLMHQEVLLKLLNSPSSFIRTTILEKSLEFLNSKIMQYLEQLGSLHVISFNSDMSITIEYMGIKYGYVSTGEMGRITLALTLAFRDVWETLNNCKINLFAMDEVIDRIGLDTSGVEMTVNALQRKNDKNIMLVTHNDTLINQSPKLLTLIKENGFTEIIGNE
jgi:DNA repair exonuclease SbcCD ATPase subunit